MTSTPCRVHALHTYPIKSCAGLSPEQAVLDPSGLDLDRAWMVTDAQGRMLTQRVLPRLALVQPALGHSEMVLRAPGMLALHVHLERVEAATRVQVWDDVVKAFDMGALAAQWFGDFLGCQARLVRFDPQQQRLSDPQWAGDVSAENLFSDGYPLLVASQASLDDLNARLGARGAAAVTMQRFRPNLVLHGLQAWDEDHLHELEIATSDGPVTLRLVKPCVRCSVPNVDPLTATTSSEPGDTLAGFRADARMEGGITFGMNAVVVKGAGRTLRVGQAVQASWNFE
jgi:uncharacterized protein YcbX